MRLQPIDQIVDVGLWRIDEEYGGIYPEGKREKNLFISPKKIVSQENTNSTEITENSSFILYDFCIPNCRYLFKKSKKYYPEEYWMEIFAYHFGDLINVPVPPTFVAYNSKTTEVGALSEWFYRPLEEKLVPGGDLLQSVDPQFDRKKGKEHNFLSVVDLLGNLGNNLINDFVKILTLDALIGNTDRHQDNWGVVEGVHGVKLSMAPAFDNGSSMGREIPESDFAKYYADSQLLHRFIDKGKPHIKWSADIAHKNRDNHAELLKRILHAFPALKPNIASCLEFSKNQLEDIMEKLVKFDITHPLTQKRADFMVHLLMCRQTNLKSLL